MIIDSMIAKSFSLVKFMSLERSLFICLLAFL